ncbi:S66 peptidase family protein [Filimonas effusa]|uniref:LD-carboxypeptidase n=1 Tax=Filimonas effusa TaxID=2508721 RepID=A0A4Q1D3S5_9BACT|nr:LD-carboxypeptidase [Filimonas effusa]RXK83060.1 LD-carboxypeptidase [Filimonas effusa]
MNRKSFLQQTGLLLAATGIPGVLGAKALTRRSVPMVVPPYLSKRDTIGITSPAGYITLNDIQSAVQQITGWGYKVKVGRTIGKKDGSLGGSDAERLLDFQEMLDDRDIKAILCARGGYGIVRIIDQLDFSGLRRHPKWIIGFSDVTLLHCHINRNHQVATIHSKMCNSFPDDWSKADDTQVKTILSIQKALSGEKMRYEVAANMNNRLGKAVGQLVGGNLRTLENLSDTRSDLYVANKILFLEDVHEPLYNIDRMFWSLKRTGKLEQLAGLIIGGFSVKADPVPADEFPKDLYAIVNEKVKGYHYPVCFDFPVGHQRNNYALKCGSRHSLTVTMQGSSLQEMR